MLRKINISEFDALAEYTYQLSQNLSKTSFPVYTDEIKTKQDFLHRSRDGIQRSDEEILVFQNDSTVQGWIHYYVIPSARQIGLCNMTIASGYADAFGELLQYWKEHHPGYQWGLYFPEENQEILNYMAEHDYPDFGQEIVDVLLFENYEYQEETGTVLTIDSDNFPIFREIHRHFETEMYWTSDRIQHSLDDWAIFVYEAHEEFVGAIYYNGTHSQNLEIFGLDILEGHRSPAVIQALLIACLNTAKHAGANSMYFFNDTQIHKITHNLGFHRVTTAHYFEGTL